jgi:hypothetical protein
MKHTLMLIGAATLAFGAPALAKPGNGHGNGHGYGHQNAYGANGPMGYGVGGCPPGLAKKNPPCVPPGIAKQQFAIGQRFVRGTLNPYAYGQIPYDLRSQYGLTPYDRYYYGNGYLYGVDPRTMLVQRVVGALLR